MGVARLLAKGWVVFCLFAGVHAVNLALARGEQPFEALQADGICTLLFAAMGLLFIGGFGASSGSGSLLARLRPHHLVPGFNEMVFIVFVAASLAVQILVAPATIGGPVAVAVQKAVAFVVPGQRALSAALDAHGLDGGRIFASAFAWLLAAIFLASAVSRIALAAGLIRLERTLHPGGFGLTLLAALYGAIAIVGVQLFFVGSVYPWFDATAFTDITGAVLIGLTPLLLAYLIVAALATLRASGPEQ